LSDTADTDQQPRLRGPRSDVARRRTEIVAAAREVFIDQGFAGARTRTIAETAGITEAVLYRYFSSKEEMFQAAILDPLKVFFDGLLPDEAHAADLAADLATREKYLRENALSWLKAMEGLVPLLGAAMSTDTDTSRTLYQERVYPMIEQAFAVASRSISTWGRPDADPKMAIYALMGISLVIALDRHLRQPDESLEDLAKKLLDQAVYGVMPLPADIAHSRRPSDA
jgi:AcrR family transcriptional regulator